MRSSWHFAIAMVFILAACNSSRGQQLEDLPTLASVEGLATAEFLTQVAPPTGFETVSYPLVDEGLASLPGWRYLVELEFDGAFARTPRTTTASARAEVWFNQLGSARRVVVQTSGELIGQEENTLYEAVRLGPDAFLVRDEVCLSNAGEDAETAAALNAGALVGGIHNAVPAGRRATINGQEAWEYRITQDELNLPAIRISEGGQIVSATGELWVSPEHDTVIRFYVNVDVENAIVFDRQLPVTGLVLLRYDLFEIGTVPNISVPFGC